jgi:hypothetical protein
MSEPTKTETPVETPAKVETPVETPAAAPSDEAKWKKIAKENEERAQALEKQLADQKLAKLKESQNWQEIAKLKEEEANAAKSETNSLKQAVINDKKTSALKTAAVKAGINPQSLDDLDLLDFDEISVETTSQGKLS